MSLLEVEGLRIRLPTTRGLVTVVDGVDYAVEQGEVFGVAGESGSGKTMSMLSLLGLLPDGAVVEGSVRFGEHDLLRMPREGGPRSSIQEARESAERDHVLRALEEANWNVSGAARALGMERTNLHKRIRALGLSRTK